MSGDQAAFAVALLDPAQPRLSGLRAWNGSDPARRLAVYRNNVHSSLVDALAQGFPVVQQLVGEEFFRAMAALYVRQAPPRSPVLAHYGEDFPDFIAGFAPAQSLPYLADMARLECARVRAYHAADAAPLTRESASLALSCGQRSGALRLLCQPSLAVLDSCYAVVSLWAAHQGEGDLSSVDPYQAEAALVLRQDLEVVLLRVPASTAAFVARVLQGQRLAEAAERAARAHADFDLSATLVLLASQGALSAIQDASGTAP